MNSIARTYHQVAMDLYDFGKIYKAKGQPQYFKGNLELAFLLDKEAAHRVQQEEVDVLWKAVYPRSAGWLALDRGKYDEAKQLAELGLQHKAFISDFEIEKLKDLLKKAKGKLELTSPQIVSEHKSSPILAIVSATNIEQYLKLLQTKNDTFQLVKIAPEDSLKIARSFLGDMVEIEVRTNEDGSFVLKDIRKAA